MGEAEASKTFPPALDQSSIPIYLGLQDWLGMVLHLPRSIRPFRYQSTGNVFNLPDHSPPQYFSLSEYMAFRYIVLLAPCIS